MLSISDPCRLLSSAEAVTQCAGGYHYINVKFFTNPILNPNPNTKMISLAGGGCRRKKRLGENVQIPQTHGPCSATTKVKFIRSLSELTNYTVDRKQEHETSVGCHTTRAPDLRRATPEITGTEADRRSPSYSHGPGRRHLRRPGVSESAPGRRAQSRL